MSQLLRPDADISVGAWTTAPLFSKVNDADSLSFISSDNNNGTSCTLGLSNPAGTPDNTFTPVISVTASKPTSGGNNPDLIVDLQQNGVSVQSFTQSISLAAWTTFQFQVTNAITDYTGLSVVLTRSGGGNPQQRMSIDVAEFYFEVGDAPATSVTVPTDSQAFTETILAPTVIVPADVGSVSGYVLIDAANDVDIQTIEEGQAINVTNTPDLNIRAEVSGLVDSVTMQLTGAASHTQTEGVAPYALFGDASGDYHIWTAPEGSYTLTTTPSYNGVSGTAYVVNFSLTKTTVINVSTPAVTIGLSEALLAPTVATTSEAVIPASTIGFTAAIPSPNVITTSKVVASVSVISFTEEALVASAGAATSVTAAATVNDISVGLQASTVTTTTSITTEALVSNLSIGLENVSVVTTGAQVVSVPVIDLGLAALDSTVATSQSNTISAELQAIDLTAQSASVSAALNVVALVAATSINIVTEAATVQSSGSRTVAVGVIASQTDLFSPSISGEANVSAELVQEAISVGSVSVSVGAGATTDAINILAEPLSASVSASGTTTVSVEAVSYQSQANDALVSAVMNNEIQVDTLDAQISGLAVGVHTQTVSTVDTVDYQIIDYNVIAGELVGGIIQAERIDSVINVLSTTINVKNISSNRKAFIGRGGRAWSFTRDNLDVG